VLAQGGILQGELFLTLRMRTMKRIETTIAFNIARRVSNHRPEESTAWNPDKILANHKLKQVCGDGNRPKVPRHDRINGSKSGTVLQGLHYVEVESDSQGK
jgi:hypothetical protein